ncbi:MAG: 4a-hydroxytetrahydrobiopterin dehydratase [Gemmatimonadaceae bacterium]|jgi:4a-hydroxytetrahydrobiopterin dehydratase|nr:4a-hydroxytetrahydrobiopterin dehydratase [Gemmatimonadaceae bacterium]
MATLLAPADLAAALVSLPRWTQAGAQITRTFQFAGFPDSVAFVTRVAFPAEAMDHHPDLDIRYNRVIVTLSTHSKGGVTDLDVALAGTIDAIAAAFSPGA